MGAAHYLLKLEAADLSEAVSPGQFAMLRCGEGLDPFLRRPLSIHQVERKQGIVSFLYRVKGKGTRWLSQRVAGDKISLLAPLGRGFSVSPGGGRGLLVGAGVGVAPLLFLASELAAQGWELVTLIGAGAAAEILRPDAFMDYGIVKTATDDGSAGIKGTILDLLSRELEQSSCDMLFACGPLPVLQGVQRMSKHKGIAAELSLEERMACGVGACLGCACRDAGGEYVRICREGPVFSAGEVVIDV